MLSIKPSVFSNVFITSPIYKVMSVSNYCLTPTTFLKWSTLGSPYLGKVSNFPVISGLSFKIT